ncbi:MAG: hypothetical protein C0412_01485 [Flavobacterium sp.]|nr:hypothetical protein [Flavobacterium sp.]
MDTLFNKLKRNTLFSLMSSLIRLFSNAILFILVAHYYGPEVFGQFTTAHSFAIIFTLFADFGFDFLLTNEIANQNVSTKFLLPRMLGIKVILSIIATLSMCCIPFFYEMTEGTRNLTYIFSLYLFFSTLLNFMFALFKGHEELRHEYVITLTLNSFLLGMLILFGVLGVSVYIIGGFFVLSRLLGLLFALQRSRRFNLSLKPIFDLHWYKATWKKISIFGIYFIFGNLFFLLDTILISIIKGDYEVGIYQSVFRLIAITLVIPEIAVNVTLPSLTKFYLSDKNKWNQLGLVINKTLYYIGLLLGFILFFWANFIIDTIYGIEKFLDSVLILQLFGVVIFIRYTVELPALMLTTSQQQYIRMLLVIGATMLNLLLNLVAIPNLGIIGAAFVSIITNLIVGIGYILAIKGFYNGKWFSFQRIIPFFFICSVLLLKYFIPSIPDLMIFIFTLVIYIPFIFYQGYDTQERLILLKSINRSFNG